MNPPWLVGPRFPDAEDREIPAVTRREVLSRDGHSCVYCTADAKGIDHVYPWIQGGGHTRDNLVACCGLCNSIAGQRVFLSGLSGKKQYVRERLADLRQKHGDQEVRKARTLREAGKPVEMEL